MTKGSVMSGNAEAGLMVWTPAPVMPKWISSGTPPMLAVTLALEMAARSEPAPVSFVVVTLNVVARAGVVNRTQNPTASHTGGVRGKAISNAHSATADARN